MAKECRCKTYKFCFNIETKTKMLESRENIVLQSVIDVLDVEMITVT